MATEGRFSTPKILYSKPISIGNTITTVKTNLNSIGTFRIFYGTTDSVGNTITWEENNNQNIIITLTTPNLVLYYMMIGSNGATLFTTERTYLTEPVPGIEIKINPAI